MSENTPSFGKPLKQISARGATLFAAGLLMSMPVLAQEQKAGNDASTNADDTFQQLIAQCDDVDVLFLRAKIRLEINRATPDAAQQAGDLLNTGMAQCGEGKLDQSKATLNQGLEIARAGVTERFGQDGNSAEVAATAANSLKDTAAEGGEKKPWWKFW